MSTTPFHPPSVCFLSIPLNSPFSVSSSFRCTGLAVFPGSREASQSHRAGSQLSGEPLCPRCAGWQPGHVLLAGCGQHCDSLCSLRSGCHEPDKAAQTRDQETWRTHYLFSGPALLMEQHVSTYTSLKVGQGWSEQTTWLTATLCQRPFALWSTWLLLQSLYYPRWETRLAVRGTR